jgi:trigger factor
MATQKNKKEGNIKNEVTSQFEQLESNKVKLTITVSPAGFREGLQYVYNKDRGHFNIPGFRKGKAPRKIIEQAYGKEVFYEDAMNFIFPEAYEAALQEWDIDPVYRPEVELGENASEANGFVLYAIVATRPMAEIAEYFGITHPKGELEPTEEEIQEVLQTEQNKNARQVSVNRPAQLDDIVTINYKGFIDGEQFEGGTADDYDLTLGSNRFIDGFEEQLVGHEVGDDVVVTVTFPEEYHHPVYAGKPATFEVEILDVQTYELPEIDDDFAQDISEFDTLEEYRESIAKKIRKSNEDNLESRINSYIMDELINRTTVAPPEEMIMGRLDEMFDDFSFRIQQQGMNVENYLRFAGVSETALKASWKKQAEKETLGMLALEAIARKENIVATDEEFSSRVGKMLNVSDDAPRLEQILENFPARERRELNKSVLREIAFEMVKEKAIPVDGPFPKTNDDEN